jgi:hypothetical protein
VRLFNIDHEDWEDVATEDSPAPPAALAWESQTAKWILLEAELEAISHHGQGTLRYTERGLNLLRKNGYEG